MGFEYRVFYGSWKNSRLMGFEPIGKSIKFDITGNIWYNKGVEKNIL